MKIEHNKGVHNLIHQKKNRQKNQISELSPEEDLKHTIAWTTYFRRNLDRFAEEYLGLKLKFYQKIMLYLMGISHVFVAICSRGTAKTYIMSVFAICKCLLYPKSKVVITASTLDQAGLIVREKISGELVDDSGILQYLIEHGDMKIKEGKDDIQVLFPINQSKIIVVPCAESARGNRATVLIYDECRLLKKGLIDSVFEPMKIPRQADFLKKEKYASDPRWKEDGISIYASSARFKHEWFWTTLKKNVESYYTASTDDYNVFASDIFVALKYNLKTPKQWATIKRQTNELDLRMEYLNEMVGEAEGAYFSFELFKANQKLRKPFNPPTTQEFNERADLKNTSKKNNETRALVIDFAFANGAKNDNTVITCMSGFFDDEKMFRNVDYMETAGGGESEHTIKRIRELFWDYQADYIVLDLRSGGEVMFNNLTKEYMHPERFGSRWNSHGFTVVADSSLHVVSNTKLDDLRARTVDRQAIPCVIPIVGTPELNSVMWQDLHTNMQDGYIRFLLDEMEFRQYMEPQKKYMMSTSKERARIMLPFVQTSMLVAEAINLEQEWRDGKLKLKEPRNGTKDRVITVAYGNYFITLLENKKAKARQTSEFNKGDWTQVFQF